VGVHTSSWQSVLASLSYESSTLVDNETSAVYTSSVPLRQRVCEHWPAQVLRCAFHVILRFAGSCPPNTRWLNLQHERACIDPVQASSISISISIHITNPHETLLM
jgi:hypothetical protein